MKPVGLIAVLAVLAALVVTACAVGATDPARPSAVSVGDERAAARAFAAAALRANRAVDAQFDEIRRRVFALYGTEGCLDAADSAPRRIERLATTVFLIGQERAYLGPVVPALERFVAELDAVPTRDRFLRSGRAAWRRQVRLLTERPAIDACAVLLAWERGGWRAADAPALDPDLVAMLYDERQDTTEPKIKRASQRLRERGVSPVGARSFTTYEMFERLEDVIPHE